MQNKTYISLAAALTVMTSLALAAPALAETNVTVGATVKAQVPSMHRGGQEGEKQGGEQRMPGIFGTVASVSGTTLTVTSKMPVREQKDSTVTTTAATTYTVDAANATVTKNNTASTLSAVAVGDTIMIEGTVNGTTVTAKVIRDGVMQKGAKMEKQDGKNANNPADSIIKGNGQPVVGGKVTAISGTTLTITNTSNATFTVDVANAVVEKGNTTSTVSAIAIGDNLIVQGAVNGSSITASSVIDQGVTTTAAGSTEKSKGGMMGFFSGIGGFFAHLFGF